MTGVQAQVISAYLGLMDIGCLYPVISSQLWTLDDCDKLATAVTNLFCPVELVIQLPPLFLSSYPGTGGGRMGKLGGYRGAMPIYGDGHLKLANWRERLSA